MQEGACDWLFEDVVEVDNAREETFSHLTTVTKGLMCSSDRSEGNNFSRFCEFPDLAAQLY